MALMLPFQVRLANSGLKGIFFFFFLAPRSVSLVMALKPVQIQHICVCECVLAWLGGWSRGGESLD